MKTRSKALLLALCAVLLVVTTVFGTLAYLTDTDNETNTFTIGEVDITLDEKDVDDSTPGKDRDHANSYKVVPGYTYEKDPTVHVTEGSSESYVRMIVTVSNLGAVKEAFPKDKYPTYYDAADNFLLQNLVKGWNEDIWPCAGIDGSEYEFRYYTTVEAKNAAVDLPALFTHVVIPGELDLDGVKALDELEINVVAHAMQADGFDDADAAWAEFTTN